MTDKSCAARVQPAWVDIRSDLAFYMEHGTSAEDSDDDAPEVAKKFEEIGDFHNYALAWDYVAPETFDDQAEGYWRYQICWGGPSEEIRFYASPSSRGNWNIHFLMHRAEFWFLDWFDGASVNVTSTDEAKWLWEWFSDVGSVQHALDEAAAA